MTAETQPASRKRISTRKVTVLGLLRAPNSKGETAKPIHGRTRMQKLVFLVRARMLNVIGDRDAVFNFDYNPVAEKYGPADLDLYWDLEFLQAMGLIAIDGASAPLATQEPDLDSVRSLRRTGGERTLPEEEEEAELSFEYLMGQQPEELLRAEAEDEEIETVYEITPRGIGMLDTIRNGLKEDDQERFDRLLAACDEVRSRFGDRPLKSLLRYVYEKYEDFTTRSTIKDDVLR